MATYVHAPYIQYDLEVVYKADRCRVQLEREIEKVVGETAHQAFAYRGHRGLLFGFSRKDTAEDAWDRLDEYDWGLKLKVKLYRIEPGS